MVVDAKIIGVKMLVIDQTREFVDWQDSGPTTWFWTRDGIWEWREFGILCSIFFL